MHSARAYLERMDRNKLEDLLREYCEEKHNIAADAVLQMCAVLGEGDASKEDPREAFLRLCRSYLTKTTSESPDPSFSGQ